MLNKLLPQHSSRRNLVRKVFQKFGLFPNKEVVTYYEYIHTLKDANIPLVKNSEHEDIKFSIVVPAYNTPHKYLKPLLDSIIGQTYRNWELILVDASTKQAASKRISTAQKLDDRIKVIIRENKGISENTNAGIMAANGDYIVFVDHDDLLDIEALNEFRNVLLNNPETDLLYSDEDKVSDNGEHYFAPHFKPGWSPDLMNCVNYITHLVAVRRTFIDKVGMLDSAKDGAQDYDFLLRVIDSGAKVAHVPKILYHWREAENSTARAMQHKPHATKSGVSALEQHLERQGITDATVISRDNRPGFYKIVYKPAKAITIIVTPFAGYSVLKAFLDRLITRTSTDNTKVTYVIPENIIFDPATRKYLDSYSVVVINGAQSHHQYLQKALKHAGETVIVVNKVLLPKTKYWLNDISGLASVPRIAAASPIIINDTDCIYDCGYVYDNDNLIRLFNGEPFTDNPTFFGNTEWCRNVDALTGNMTILRKNDFQAYLKSHKVMHAQHSTSRIVKNYTLMQAEAGKDLCVWANTVFSDLTILGSYENTNHTNRYFNESLVAYGNKFHVAVDDSDVISRIIRTPVEDVNHE